MRQKGLTLDGNTFRNCSSKIPSAWPNTDQPVGTVQIPRAWDRSWPDSERPNAWGWLRRYVKTYHAKVLLGMQISCNKTDDDIEWSLTKDLLQELGPDSVMGVVFGHELDSLMDRVPPKQQPACQNMWNLVLPEKGYAVSTIINRVQELDGMGFGNIKVTSAFGSKVFTTPPFINTQSAGVYSMMQVMVKTFGLRWVFSFNLYPYFSPRNQPDPGNKTLTCDQAMLQSACFNGGCLFTQMASDARDRMTIARWQDHLLWITGTGWPTKTSRSLVGPLRNCTRWSGWRALQYYYQGFLEWDLGLPAAPGKTGFVRKPPDHVFWAMARDDNSTNPYSTDPGMQGAFGLIENCDSLTCKLSYEK